MHMEVNFTQGPSILRTLGYLCCRSKLDRPRCRVNIGPKSCRKIAQQEARTISGSHAAHMTAARADDRYIQGLAIRLRC